MKNKQDIEIKDLLRDELENIAFFDFRELKLFLENIKTGEENYSLSFDENLRKAIKKIKFNSNGSLSSIEFYDKLKALEILSESFQKNSSGFASCENICDPVLEKLRELENLHIR